MRLLPIVLVIGVAVAALSGEAPEGTRTNMSDSTSSNATDSYERTIFAGGCFWGVEYYFQNAPGVISTRVGYTGGHVENPTYREVCNGTTGHIEAIEITFDPQKTTFEDMAKLFFETHDPTQVNRQGPDIGEQYQSVVFYLDGNQKKVAEKLIGILTEKGYKVATKLREATAFWEAEEYHQAYYEKNGREPYCHAYVKRF
jgi:peptide methionine sulfoxide reductase msrA/msrB